MKCMMTGNAIVGKAKRQHPRGLLSIRGSCYRLYKHSGERQTLIRKPDEKIGLQIYFPKTCVKSFPTGLLIHQDKIKKVSHLNTWANGLAYKQ